MINSTILTQLLQQTLSTKRMGMLSLAKKIDCAINDPMMVFKCHCYFVQKEFLHGFWFMLIDNPYMPLLFIARFRRGLMTNTQQLVLLLAEVRLDGISTDGYPPWRGFTPWLKKDITFANGKQYFINAIARATATDSLLSTLLFRWALFVSTRAAKSF